jgi:phosphoribosylglycinamide formyltransferase 1
VLAALRPLEHALLPEAVRLVAAGAVRIDPENPRRTIVEPPAGS